MKAISTDHAARALARTNRRWLLILATLCTFAVSALNFAPSLPLVAIMGAVWIVSALWDVAEWLEKVRRGRRA